MHQQLLRAAAAAPAPPFTASSSRSARAHVRCPATRVTERLAYGRREVVKLGQLEVSPMGLGTWAWGNKFLWGYETDMDDELQQVFNLVVSRGINLFDTADSYGTGALNGRSEQLLGQFIRYDVPHAVILGVPWRPALSPILTGTFRVDFPGNQLRKLCLMACMLHLVDHISAATPQPYPWPS
eukprot:GHUV01023714.1.p1 GENE.GHUV01023714.1~~GHUV01023714.1.p1  ORF type:complete len:183 (+),score=37.62 GHUV01023714.1:212-760(+)